MLCELCNKKLQKENGVFQTFELEKFFDKESLLDTIDALKREARISDKCYRLWFKLNKNATVGVSTSVGNSEFRTVKNSVGQGMFGAALASSLIIGCAINSTFRGMTSARMGSMSLNCVVMQDDIVKMNAELNEARIGCNMIDMTVKKKQHSVNYDNRKYTIFGSRKYRRETLETLDRVPMMMGSEVIGNAVKEKYLGVDP